MYIHSIKLVNYKSIGDYAESEIILEQGVTAIIGKNESGKSNILEGLSRIQLLLGNDNAFSHSIVNRNCETETENYYIITLKPLADEIAMGAKDDTQITYKKNEYVATGGILQLYQSIVGNSIDKVLTFLAEISNNPFQLNNQELNDYKKYIAELSKKEHLNVPKVTRALEYLKARITKLSKIHQDEFESLVLDSQSKWLSVAFRIPAMFYRKADKHLNSTYKIDEIKKELGNASVTPNSLLRELVKAIGLSANDFITAARSGNNSKQISLRRRINKLIDENINKKFEGFYLTEKISLLFDSNNGVSAFAVESDNGQALTLSERSNGLRWYLETFIDTKANDIDDRNVVYLLDEPGASLHVNAQRELIQLFHHLSDKGNQVVYTTHSPYMLETEDGGITRIRAVVKDSDGYTRIYKTAYDVRIAPYSQKDTLAPLINALGMNLNDTFGPTNNKTNIVIEGMSDYIYISLMTKVLNVKLDNYSIIPSVGASNCVNICSILHGWGCKYLAIFDYDKAGVETGGEYMHKNLFYELGKQYLYLADVTQDDIDAKTYNFVDKKCVIEDLVTKEEISKFCSATNTSNELSKPLIAKIIAETVTQGSYELGDECKNNFTQLFNRIFKSQAN